jgi:hypothetical protein
MSKSMLPDSHLRTLAIEKHNRKLGLPPKTPATTTIGNTGLLNIEDTSKLNIEQRDYLNTIAEYFTSIADVTKTGLSGNDLHEIVKTVGKSIREKHRPEGKGVSTQYKRSRRKHQPKRPRRPPRGRSKYHKKTKKRKQKNKSRKTKRISRNKRYSSQ